MDAGRVIATGTPGQLMERTGAANLEDAFVALLPAPCGRSPRTGDPPRVDPGGEPAIQADRPHQAVRFLHRREPRQLRHRPRRDLRFPRLQRLRKVHHDEDADRPPPATEGQAKLFGDPVDADDLAIAQARRLHVAGLLPLRRAHGPSEPRTPHPHLRPAPRSAAPGSTNWSIGSASAPISKPRRGASLGLKQRLSLAVAVLHEPDMLLLDEPTSGVDPVARDEFWELLIDLSRRQGVTIFVSTHFMNEALRCDRISLMHAGTVLACDTPAQLMATPRYRRPGGRLHRLHHRRYPRRAGIEEQEMVPTPTLRPSRLPPPRQPPRTTTMSGPGSAWDGCSPTADARPRRSSATLSVSSSPLSAPPS